VFTEPERQSIFHSGCNFFPDRFVSLSNSIDKKPLKEVMNTVSKLLVGFSVPVLFILLSQTGTADTMEAKVASGKTEVTTLAGGCFWCTESDLEKLPGVLDVVSGYSGGKEENPTYRQVASGRTGHIEVISVKFDTNVVSYEEVLDHFFRHIDPTDNKGSFVDRGVHYRPTVFYHNIEQKQIAEQFMMEIDKAMIFPKPLKTELIDFDKFYPAEAYHQDYYKKSSLKYKYYRFASGRDQYLDEVFGDDRKANPKTLRQLIDAKNAPAAKVYEKHSDEEIKGKLTKLQYYVTQEDGTERPFNKSIGITKKRAFMLISLQVSLCFRLPTNTNRAPAGPALPSRSTPAMW
jgi:peptide methionine sulfoxide reductase msrA/msrB